MLEDGVISAEEQELIEAEAKRLHLSKSELDRLLEKAKVQMGLDQAPSSKSSKTAGASTGELNLEFLSKHPELAAEQLKIMISKLQQITSISDQERLYQYFDDPNNVTPLQSELVKLILMNSQKTK
jgi:hypothetical protein